MISNQSNENLLLKVETRIEHNFIMLKNFPSMYNLQITNSENIMTILITNATHEIVCFGLTEK